MKATNWQRKGLYLPPSVDRVNSTLKDEWRISLKPPSHLRRPQQEQSSMKLVLAVHFDDEGAFDSMNHSSWADVVHCQHRLPII